MVPVVATLAAVVLIIDETALRVTVSGKEMIYCNSTANSKF